MPTDVAQIYDKAGEQLLILETRCQMVYPFSAPGWTDLRAGFFLSITKNDAEDDTAVTPETIDDYPNRSQERVWIGLKTNNDLQPLAPDVGFIGYTNSVSASLRYDSELLSSDAGIGTDNAYYWRFRGSVLGNPDDDISAAIIDDRGPAAQFENVNAHFVQDPDNTPGYATLLMLRVTRPSPTSNTLTVSIKQGTNSGDVLFSDAPTLDLLESNLVSYPATVQTKIITHMRNIPDALYLYWPFHLSRLRCHCCGVLKFL